MNKKLLVQLIIIIVAFTGSGLVLYNGFFKNNNKPALGQSYNGPLKNNIAALGQSAAPAGGSQAPEGILPYGNNLDFSILKQQTFYYNQVQYPTLGQSNSIGIPEENLIQVPTAK